MGVAVLTKEQSRKTGQARFLTLLSAVPCPHPLPHGAPLLLWHGHERKNLIEKHSSRHACSRGCSNCAHGYSRAFSVNQHSCFANRGQLYPDCALRNTLRACMGWCRRWSCRCVGHFFDPLWSLSSHNPHSDTYRRVVRAFSAYQKLAKRQIFSDGYSLHACKRCRLEPVFAVLLAVLASAYRLFRHARHKASAMRGACRSLPYLNTAFTASSTTA